MAIWQVYALRYGQHTDRTGADNFLRPGDLHDTPMPLDYFIWVARSGDRTIVVDTGFTHESAAKRGRKLSTTVDAALLRFGVVAAEVSDVVITHLHYDHAGNLDLFPKAFPSAGSRDELRYRSSHVQRLCELRLRRRGRRDHGDARSMRIASASALATPRSRMVSCASCRRPAWTAKMENATQRG